MLHDDIWEFVITSGCKNLNDMMYRAREHEINLDYIRKRGEIRCRLGRVMGRDPRLQTSVGQQGRGQFNRYGKLHNGGCCSKGLGCYKCGMVGHVTKDCPQGQFRYVFTAIRWSTRRSNVRCFQEEQ